MTARVLGGFEVIVDGRRIERVEWRRAAAQLLMKLLLVTPGHRLPRERVAETLWPDWPPDGLGSLRKAIHFARRAIAPLESVIGDGPFVSLDPDRLDLDLDRLDDAFVRACATGVEVPSHALDVVLELGGLELLPEDGDVPWLGPPRERLLRDWERCALPAARRLLAAGRRDDAHVIVDRLLDRDPTDEAAHALAMAIFGAEGRHGACRREFRRCVATLREELGVEPLAETVEAFHSAEHAGQAGAGLGRAERGRNGAERR